MLTAAERYLQDWKWTKWHTFNTEYNFQAVSTRMDSPLTNCTLKGFRWTLGQAILKLEMEQDPLYIYIYIYIWYNICILKTCDRKNCLRQSSLSLQILQKLDSAFSQCTGFAKGFCTVYIKCIKKTKNKKTNHHHSPIVLSQKQLYAPMNSLPQS